MPLLLKLGLLFVATTASFLLSTVSGGGASLILIPVLNLLIVPAFVPFSLTIGTFTNSASRIIVFRKSINWKIFSWFFPFSVPAVVAGAWLMKFINPLYLEVLVALFLVINLPELFKSPQKLAEEEKPYPNYVLALVGFLAGFVSGITGAVGLLFNKFYLRYGLKKEEIVATRAANEIFLHLVKLIVYLALGLYSRSALWMGLTIATGAVVSSYAAKFILPFISEYLFRKIGYGAMVVAGVFLLTHTIQNIVKQDNLFFTRNEYNETVMNWRNSRLVLEFSLGEGLEIERQIKPEELPPGLKSRYDELSHQYDRIYVEIVYKIGYGTGYEFYCFKDNHLTKYEFEPD